MVHQPFLPDGVRPQISSFLSLLVLCHVRPYLFITVCLFFKELISFMGSRDKCVFNALIIHRNHCNLGEISISVHLSSLPVARLSDAPRRRSVVTWDSARMQGETTESSAWLFNGARRIAPSHGTSV